MNDRPNLGSIQALRWIAAALDCHFVQMRHQVTASTLGVAATVLAVKLRPFPKFPNTLADLFYGNYLAHLPVIYCIHLALKNRGTNFAGAHALMTVMALPTPFLFGRIEHSVYKGRTRPAIYSPFEKINCPIPLSLEKQ